MEFRDWGIKALDFIEKPIEEDAFINILEGSVRSGKTVDDSEVAELHHDGPAGAAPHDGCVQRHDL